MNPLALHCKNKERRNHNFSSEFRNGFFVRNKCEQLKLEKQHKSLERLRANESLNLTNRKKEILDLQMSIMSSKLDENSLNSSSTKRESSQGTPVPVITVNSRKTQSTSRHMSITNDSSLKNFLSANEKDEKKLSRSFSAAGQLNLSLTRKHFAVQTYVNNIKERPSSRSSNESHGERRLSTLLPPIQMAPLHKQRTRSLRKVSSNSEISSRQKMSVEQKRISCSWDDLQYCRYLRHRSDQNSCLELA